MTPGGSKGHNLVGATIGNYQLVALVGKGGMGEVYKARHPVLGREVAVKVLGRSLSDNPELVQRFRQEAQAVNRIGHESIVEVTDFGVLQDGRSYYVMELLQGQALQGYLEEKKKLSAEEACNILFPVLDALAAAHQMGIIHRDIKPDNIFLTRARDGSLRPKVLDFGIAKMKDPGEGGAVTQTGALMGTPMYMSPEQAAGAIKNIGPWSDIYSLGAVLYTMLAGTPPFPGEAFGELLLHHMQTPPPSLASVRPDVPPALDAVIRKAMAKAPNDRYPNTAAMKTDLLSAIRAHTAAFAVHAQLQQSAAGPSPLPFQQTQPSFPGAAVPLATPPGATPPGATPPPQSGAWQQGVPPAVTPPGAMPTGTPPPPQSGAWQQGVPPAVTPPGAMPTGTPPPPQSGTWQQGVPPAVTPPGAAATGPVPPAATPGPSLALAATQTPAPSPPGAPAHTPLPAPPSGVSAAQTPRAYESIPGATKDMGWSSISASSSEAIPKAGSTLAPGVGTGLKVGLIVGVAILALGGAAAGGYFLFKDRLFPSKKTKHTERPARPGPDGRPSDGHIAGPSRKPPARPAESSNPWIRIERPRKTVTLGLPKGPDEDFFFRPEANITCCDTSFDIQQHEVTWGEYLDWAKGHNERFFAFPAYAPGDPQTIKDLPVTGVPWELATAYCKSLGGTLPSEAQWEYAARGPSLKRNPWGDLPADPLNTALLTGKKPQPKPVCQSEQDRVAHGTGRLCDLGANALEWTRDAFVHPYFPNNPPRGFTYGGEAARRWRAVRGLGPLPSVKEVPSSAGTYRTPGCVELKHCEDDDQRTRFALTGFRCARTGDGQSPAAAAPPAAPARTGGSGTLGIAAIQAAVHKQMGGVNRCYLSARLKQKNLKGTVELSFTINPTGAVKSARISNSTLGSRPAHQCILSVVRKWRFPRPKGGPVELTYPLTFPPPKNM